MPVLWRLAAGFLVLVAASLVATCRLSDLVNPAKMGSLSLAPLALQDSARAGSLAPRVTSVSVGITAEAVPWSLRVLHASAWLKPADSAGMAPDTLSIALDPSGLGAGDYRDTLVFSVAGPTIAPVRVPVEFRVTGCVPVALTSGAVVADSLTTADCGAPHRTGRVAKLYAFTGNANDSVSLHLASASFGAYLVLDSAAQALVPSFVESSACRPGQAGACLAYVRLPENGNYLVEATSVGAGATGAFALSFTTPRPPAAPDSLAQLTFDGVTAVPAGGAVTQDSVLLRAVLADPDTDSVRIEVEVRPVGTSFAGTATAAGAFGPSGARGSVLVTGLANFASYHWQARAVDRTGRASAWVAFGTGGADFRVVVPQPPVAPASLVQLKSDGLTPLGVDSATDQSTVLFQALLNDPDSGDVVRLEVEVKPVGTGFVDTATVSSTPVPRGTVATATITGLADGTGYHWQARAVDETGRASAWVSFGGNAETQPDFRVMLAATQLAVLTQPTNVAAGSPITPAVRVAAQDAGGNTITSFTGTVTAAIGTNPKGDSLSGTTAVAAVAGVATFSNLRLHAVGSGYTLLFSVGAIVASSGPFAVTPGAATALAFTTEPGNATAGTALAPAVQVTARDSLGNVATGFTGTVTLALANNPSSDTLSGTTTAQAVAGVATFSNAIVRRAGTGYTLAASATGLSGTTSTPFNVAASTGLKLAVTTQPAASAASGIALTRQPAVQIEDSTGNLVTTPGVTITAFIDSGPVAGSYALSGGTATTADGLATFAGLSITGTVGRYVLGFTAQGYQGAVSAPVTLSAGAATQLAMASQPSAFAQSGVPFVLQPVVQLEDASKNIVLQPGVSVTAAVATGAPALGGTETVATNASGAAVFTDLSISGAAGPRTLGFTSGTLAGATSTTVTVSAGVATQIAKFVGDSQTTAVGAAVPVPPAVRVRDASSNPVAGVGVTFAVASGGGTVTPSAVATDSLGVAAVTSWTLGATAGANTLTATAAGLAGSPVTFHATGVPGTASTAKSVVTVSAAGVASGSTVTLTLQAKDSAGNDLTVGGSTVVFSDSGGTSTGTIGATADSGNGKYTAPFTGVLAGTATTIRATINGAAVTSALPAVTVTPGPVAAATSVVSASSGTVASGSAVTLQLAGKDAAGNAVRVGGAAVVFSASGGTSTGTIGAVADSGDGKYTAAFTGLVAGSATTIGATVNGTAVGTPLPTVTVTPGAAQSLAFTTEPANTTAGAPFTVVVTARDAAGNTATGFTSQVTVAIAAGTGKPGATLGGTKSVAAVAGVATFGGLSIDSTGTGYQLGATATGLVAATSTAFNIAAGTGGRLVFTTEPVNTTAGTAFGVVVTAKDSLGNTISGFTGAVTLSITAGTGKAGATLLGTTTATAAGGVATFTGLQVDSSGTGYSLTATATGISSGVSTAFAVAPGAVSTAKSSLTTSAASVASGSAVTLTLQARDAFGNALTAGGATVVFSDSGGTSTGTIGATADSGNGKYTAPFTGVLAGTATTIRATINGAAVTSAEPAVTVTPGPVAAAKSAVSVQGATVASGATDTLRLQARDAAGNDLTTGGATVVFSASGGTSTGTIGAVIDNGNGTYAAVLTGVLAGTADTIHATINGTAVTGTLPSVTVTPGPVSAAKTTVVASLASVTASNGTVPDTVTVTAHDAAGNAVPGATVSLSASGSGNTLVQPSGPTGATGVAIGTFASTSAGSHTITAVVAGVTATEQPAVSVTPAAAAQLAFAVEPSDVVAGAAIAPPVTVQVRDAFQNLTASTASVTVALSANPGGAALGGTLTVAAVAGVATFSNLSLNKVANGYALSATSGTLTGATSATFNVTASAASLLAFTVEPANAAAGAPFGVTVTAKDSLGNTATTFTGKVALAITSGSGRAGAALRGVDTVAAVAGVATFGGLSIDSVGTGYTLTASATGATSATSSAFNVTPAPASRLSFTTQPASTTAGAGFGVVVTARDSLGNTATGFAGSVSLAITGGTGKAGAALRGTTSAAAVAGVATFSGLSVDSAGTGYTLTASATGVTGAASAAFSVAAGPASQLAYVAQPVSRVAGATFGLSVAARDSLGNVATTFTGSVALAITSGTGRPGASLVGTASATAVSGVAAFAGLSIDSAGAGYTLTASATGPASAVSAAFNITAGAAASLTKSAGDNLTGPVGTTLGTTQQVRVADAFGNAVAGVSVTFAADSGGGSVNPVTATTDTAGHAATTRTLGSVAGTQTTIAIATIGAAPDTVRFHATATVGGATQMTKAAGDAQADTVGGTLPIALAVKVTDALTNPVSGVTVTWAVTGGGGSVVPLSSVSNDSGLARTTWTLGTAVTPTDSTQTVRATAVGTPSNFIATARPASVSAAQSTVAVAPGSIVAGGTGSTITVTARDGFGNVIPGKAVVLAATGGGNTLTQPSGSTNANGVATGTLVSTVAESKTVSATVGGVAVTQTAAVTVTPAAASAAQSVVTVSAASVASGGTDTLKLQAKDAFGNNLGTGGAAVVFSLSGGTSGGTVGSTTDNGNGTYAAVFTATAAGTADTVHATIGGVAVTTALPTVTVTAGGATKLAFTQQPSAVVAGATMAPAVTVAVEDASGNVVTTASGTITLGLTGSPAGVTLTGGSAQAVTNGVATFSGLSVNKAGSYTLTPTTTVTGVTTLPASGSFAVSAGAATQLVWTQQPGAVAAGAAITPAVTASVEDADGNVVTTASGTVTLGLTGSPAGVTLTGGGAQPVTNGVATFGGLSVDKVGSYTLTPVTTVSGVTTLPASGSFAVSAGAAAQLAWTQQPSAVVAGATMVPPVTVTVEDANGNVVTAASGTVTLALTAPGGATLTGGGAQAVTNGVATFSGLSVNKAGTYTLTPTTSVSGVTTLPASGSFAVSVGAASQLLFTQQPSAVVAGATMAPAVTVAVEDAGGNVVTTASGTITLGLTGSPAGVTLTGGGAQAVTNGVATFSGLSVNKVGSYTLTPTTTVTGVTSLPASGSFAVSAGAARQLVFTTQPPNTTAGTAFTVVVTAEDSLGNTATGFGGTDTLGIGANPGGGTLSGTTAAAAVGGVATFSNLSIDKAATGYRLTARSGALPVDTSAAFTISTGGVVSASQSTVASAPTSITASSGSSSSTVTVTAKDALANVIQGVTVSVAATGSGNSLAPTFATTNGSGVATFTFSSTAAGAHIVSANVGGVIATQQDTITVAPAAPVALAFAAGPSNVAAGAVITPPVQVQVQDAFTNVVTTASGNVTLGLTGSPAGVTLTGGGAQTVTSGVATFSGLSVDKTGTYSLTPGTSVGGVTTTPASGSFTVSAGAASAAQTTASVPAGTAGTPTQVTITVRDANGNVRTASNDAALLAVAVSGSNTANPTVTSAGSGTYTASYTPNASGTDNVAITLSSAAIGGSPYTSPVSAGGPSAAQTTASVPAGTAGSATTITITVRDANGNVRTGSNDAALLAVTVSGSNAATPTVSSAGSGTYTASYTPSVAGTDNVAITLSSVAIGGSPYTSAVSPGAASAAQTTASVPAGTAGGTTTITITVRDANGNVRTGSNDASLLVVSVSGSNTATPTVSSAGSGTYTASYTPAVAGSDNVAITLSSVAIKNSPYTSTVSPGAPSAAQTTASVPAGTAGTATQITITVRDASGNVRTGSDDAALLAVAVSGSNTANPTVTSAGSGIYTASYTPTVAGSDNVAVTLSSVAIKNSPYASSVSPGAASSAQTTASVPAGTAGSATTITITVRDANGNVRTGSNDAALLAVTVSGSNTATPTVSNAGSGTYTASYTPAVAGTDNVAITLSSVAISGSPYASTVSPGGPSATQTTASVPAGVAGSATTITITVRDASGNVRTANNDAALLAVAVSGSNTANPAVTSAGSGTYTASYTPTVAGTDNVAITLSSVGIKNSPYTSTVSPGAASAAQTTASVPSGTAGSATTITITVRDANGNVRTVSNDASLLAVTVSGSNAAAPTVSSAGSGTYTASYTPAVAGTDNVAITLSGAAIGGSPYVSAVSPGAPAAAQTTASVPAGTAGTATQITITVRDASGNVRTGSNDAGLLAVTVSGSNTATPTVSSAGSGTYTASYTPSVAGTDNVAITLSSVAIKNSPYSSTVSPGAASAAQTTASVPASGTAGSATQITITVRDAHGNIRTGSNDAALLAVGVSGSNTATPTVSSAGSGTYTASYTPTASGSDNIAITLSSTAIQGSPFTSTVSPGAPSAAQTTAVVPAGTAGSATTVTVTVRDASGNVRTGSDDHTLLAGSVTGVNSASLTFASAGSGTYTASYTPTVAGSDNIAITLSGTPIQGSPYSSTVSPGAVSIGLTGSTVGASPTSVSLGSAQTSTITVQLKDANGNNLTASGGTLDIAVDPSSTGTGTVGSVTDNGDGTYTATFTPTGITGGTIVITATLEGVGQLANTATITVTL